MHEIPEVPGEPVVIKYTTDGSDPTQSVQSDVQPSAYADEIVDAALAATPEPRQLRFYAPEEAPAGSAWPNLPPGGRFLSVRRQQHLRNPKRNLRKELSKFFGGALSGRQWVKRRKEYLRVVAAREGMTRQDMKRQARLTPPGA
jgi:hypothetical protein